MSTKRRDDYVACESARNYRACTCLRVDNAVTEADTAAVITIHLSRLSTARFDPLNTGSV